MRGVSIANPLACLTSGGLTRGTSTRQSRTRRQDPEEAVSREGALHAEREDSVSSVACSLAEPDGRVDLSPIRNMTLVEASRSATWSNGMLIRTVTQKWKLM